MIKAGESTGGSGGLELFFINISFSFSKFKVKFCKNTNTRVVIEGPLSVFIEFKLRSIQLNLQSLSPKKFDRLSDIPTLIEEFNI